MKKTSIGGAFCEMTKQKQTAKELVGKDILVCAEGYDIGYKHGSIKTAKEIKEWIRNRKNIEWLYEDDWKEFDKKFLGEKE